MSLFTIEPLTITLLSPMDAPLSMVTPAPINPFEPVLTARLWCSPKLRKLGSRQWKSKSQTERLWPIRVLSPIPMLLRSAICTALLLRWLFAPITIFAVTCCASMWV